MKYEIELDIENADTICVMTENNDGGIKLSYVPVKPIKEEPNPHKRWRADYAKKYWFISSVGTVTNTKDLLGDNDDARYEIGNYYETKEEAEEALERFKVVKELELHTAKEIDKDAPYWTIVCVRNDHNVSIHVSTYSYVIYAIPFMFASKEDAEAAIDAIGKERLKKFFFRIKEG